MYIVLKPAKVTGVQSSLASLPYFDGTNYVSVDQTEHNLAEKVSTSSVSVDKTADKTYVGDNNKTVTYTLTASTAGSIDNQLKKYAIVDTMNEGLTFNENSVVVKYDGVGDALTLGTDYSIKRTILTQARTVRQLLHSQLYSNLLHLNQRISMMPRQLLLHTQLI